MYYQNNFRLATKIKFKVVMVKNIKFNCICLQTIVFENNEYINIIVLLTLMVIQTLQRLIFIFIFIFLSYIIHL